VAEEDSLALQAHDGAVTVDVHVTPRASRSEITGVRAGALRVTLHAPPVDGAANDALIALFAKTFRVPRSAVSVVRGVRGRHKTLRLVGVDADAVRSVVASTSARR